MLVLTTDTLPEGMVIEKSYGVIQAMGDMNISASAGVHSLSKDNHRAINALLEQAELARESLGVSPNDCNAIVGVKHSTAVCSARNGHFIYITYIGTLVKLRDTRQDATS